MRIRPSSSFILAMVGSAALAGACSATKANNGFGDGVDGTGGAGTGASGPVGTGGAATSTGSPPSGGAGGGIFGSGGGAAGCPNHCSSDLHSVVDCNGKVLSTCAPDQGCGANGCVPACKSAEENKSTIGCDYFAVDPDIISDAYGACFAAFIANTWGSPVSIAVERGGQTLDVSSFARIPQGSGQSITYAPLPNGQLPPGQVAVLFLSSLPDAKIAPCPQGMGVGFAGDGAVHGTGKGEAFHVTTSAPVVAYDIFPYGGGPSAATSATLLLPITSWDTNYIGVDAYKKSTLVTSAQPSMDLVAAEDGTTITIRPTAAIQGGGGVQAAAKDQPITYTLDKGQVLQLTQDAELIGSPIQSNKPIGLWGAASCLSIAVDMGACDSAHQQIPPVKALGSEYVAARYRDRFDGVEEASPWRLVGAVGGTTLSYEPSPPAGAPSALDVGQVAEFRAPGPFVVKSQDANHPFYMSGHMTGCQEVNPKGDDCRGDPEFVNVIPPQQYMDDYIFFTDPTYPETDLVVVRTKVGTAFEDVTLDCAGTLGGWQPVGSSGNYEMTHVDLVRHNFEKQGNCDNGRHEMKSQAPFGLTVWGWGTAETGGAFANPQAPGFYTQAVSYAYPGGARLQPINTVVVPPTPK